jgi:antitoxin (DNA-binding transcriptional repressor) of toxin-antitoxin stability system
MSAEPITHLPDPSPVSYGTLDFRTDQAYAADAAMEITTRTADQVRVPRVAAGEAVVVTRHGAPVCAVIAIEDLRILERWKAALAATRPVPLPPGPAALAAEAGELDDDEFPDAATVDRILGAGS